MKRETHR